MPKDITDANLKLPPPRSPQQEKEKRPSDRPGPEYFEARARSRPRFRPQTGLKEPGPEVSQNPEGSLEREDDPAPDSPDVARPVPPSAAQMASLLALRSRRILRSRVTLGRALAACALVLLFVAWAFYWAGRKAGRVQALAQISKQGIQSPPEFEADLDRALQDLRSGHPDQAMGRLAELEKKFGSVSSLTYLVSLAAMQNGNAGLAEAKAVESIAKRERVSDALALRAVLETQKAGKGFGDPRIRAEDYLRQAMVADAANPFPRIELATLLRYSKRDAEALALLEGARSRLNPVDSHTVVDVTLALMKLQEIADPELPEDIDPDKDPASLFSAAYAAMRAGDFTRAADVLRLGKGRLPADLFDYLVNDPALRKYCTRPELKEFYQ